MILTVETPATIFDMAELGRARSQIEWAVVREMWSAGETFALRSDGRLIALVGLYPTEYGAEAWFNALPDLSRHMGFVIRQIRLTLASRSYPEIVVICTSEAGKRIARLCGFQFVERIEHGEIWHGRSFGRRKQREQEKRGACEAAGGAATAPDVGAAGAAAGGD